MALSSLKLKALPNWSKQRVSRPTELPLFLAAMLDYYNKRLSEYEAIYAKPERQADLQQLVAQLQADVAHYSVLELACGTGWWTERLAPHASAWVATDADEGALEVVRHKNIRGLSATQTLNAYAPQINTPVDCVFAAHWYSHLLHNECDHFFNAVRTCLKPGGRLIMLDNKYVKGSSTPISRTDAHGNTYQTRPLKDGSTHEVLKNFPSHLQLQSAGEKYFAHCKFEDQLTMNISHYWYAVMLKA